MTEQFDELSDEPLSKTAFAKLIGVSRSRVHAYVTDGMPVSADGKVVPRQAVPWLDERFPNRRKSKAPAPTAALQASRAEKEAIRVEMSRLELERQRGRLIDREAAQRAVFALARAERDSWFAWVAQSAPELAAELNVDEGQVFFALDRLVRSHLHRLADAPLEIARD